MPIKEPIADYNTTEMTVQRLIDIDLPRTNRLNIDNLKGKTLTLPSELNELAEEIEHSKYILQLEDNWDDEGAIKYETTTWQKAVTFISTYAKMMFEISSQIISTPSIYQGPQGSIDIYWDTEQYYLLINIPAGIDTKANFYGSDRKNTQLEGTIDTGLEDRLNLGLIFILENIRESNVGNRTNP